MSANAHCTVIAYVRPKPGAEEQLLAIRERMVEEFRTEMTGFISADLYRVDGSDEWRDVVVFADRSAVESSGESSPAYREWSELVELIRYEILDELTHHVA